MVKLAQTRDGPDASADDDEDGDGDGDDEGPWLTISAIIAASVRRAARWKILIV